MVCKIYTKTFLRRNEDMRNTSGVNLVCFDVIFDLNNTFFEKCEDLNK